MRQRSILLIGTSNLWRLRLDQHHCLRSVIRIQQIIFRNHINPEELQKKLQEHNCIFDIVLIHSGNWLYPTRLHNGHLCLQNWYLENATEHIIQLIRTVEPFSKLTIITETHPRILHAPRNCLSFNPMIQGRFWKVIKNLLHKRVLNHKVRFLSCTTVVQEYFLKNGEGYIPWNQLPLTFSRRFLNSSEIHLGQQGNVILQDLLVAQILNIARNYFFYGHYVL